MNEDEFAAPLALNWSCGSREVGIWPFTSFRVRRWRDIRRWPLSWTSVVTSEIVRFRALSDQIGQDSA